MKQIIVLLICSIIVNLGSICYAKPIAHIGAENFYQISSNLCKDSLKPLNVHLSELKTKDKTSYLYMCFYNGTKCDILLTPDTDGYVDNITVHGAITTQLNRDCLSRALVTALTTLGLTNEEIMYLMNNLNEIYIESDDPHVRGKRYSEIYSPVLNVTILYYEEIDDSGKVVGMLSNRSKYTKIQ